VAGDVGSAVAKCVSRAGNRGAGVAAVSGDELLDQLAGRNRRAAKMVAIRNLFARGTIWILALLLWPITLFAALAAWRRLEAAQFECEPAMTGWSLLRWLLMPVAKGELALAAVLTFVLALNNFAVPAILQTKVLPDEMWVQFNTKFDTLARSV
jgi:ABC-type Fe3+ transport system permease subunit